jgi:hypothetical protein
MKPSLLTFVFVLARASTSTIRIKLMTRLILTFMVLFILCLQAVAQQVNFNNSVLSSPPDRLVYSNFVALIGSPLTEPATFVAQLYYGANPGSLQPITAIGPARFRPGTTGPGLWLGGNRTLIGFNIGDTVTLEVRAWDAGGIGLTFDQVRASGGWYAFSQAFTYVIPPAAQIPSSYYMENFRAFSTIPEPAIAAFLAAGLPLLWLFSRKKK